MSPKLLEGNNDTMRANSKTFKNSCGYHANHSTRKVWLSQTRRKNRRFARQRLSDNHSVKRGYEPLRREKKGCRVQIGEKMTYFILFIGLVAMFVGMSVETPDGAISKVGAIVSLIGMLVVVLTCAHAERWLNV